jgi:hypothetical protein
MNALARFTDAVVASATKVDVHPTTYEPRVKPARPMTGFLALLSPEERAAALAYDGPQDHGDEAFLRPQSVE